jgi:hypothetical protein
LTLQPSAAKAPPPEAAAEAKPYADDMGAEPGQAAEAPAFIPPSPEPAEVPAAPPVHISGEDTNPSRP